MKGLEALFEKIALHIPEVLTGRTREYEKELYTLYGKTENHESVNSMQRSALRKYVYITGLLVCLLAVAICNEVLDSGGVLNIDNNGRAYIERPEGKKETLRADLILEGYVGEKHVKKPVLLNINPQGSNKTKKKPAEDKVTLDEMAVKNLNSLIYGINKGDKEKVVYLPVRIDGMKNLSWRAKESNPIPMIILMGVLLLVCTYLTRFDKVKKLKKACADSIADDLPEFLNKLVLLMNAGLVLTSAFEKAVEDYKDCGTKKKSYFYEQLIEINVKAFETNASVPEELKRFAERSGSREFMRVTNVIWDNIHKGTELVDILQNESGFLWFQRKKRTEEKGRIAETKLTMPLALQLVILIMITLAPAMIDM